MSSSNKRTIQVRIQVVVEAGSIEESVLDYLNDKKVRPFTKTQMFMAAFMPFWQSIVGLHQQQPLEKVLNLLENSRYLWHLHEQYIFSLLKNQTGINSFELQGDHNPHSNENSLGQENGHKHKVQSVSLLDEPVVETMPFNPFGDENVFLRS